MTQPAQHREGDGRHNPIALRMKELETLEKVTKKIDKISVYGGLDSVLKDLVKIRVKKPASQ